jgi:N-acetylglutamate synthase-like GNAT family acetyltransferase
MFVNYQLSRFLGFGKQILNEEAFQYLSHARKLYNQESLTRSNCVAIPPNKRLKSLRDRLSQSLIQMIQRGHMYRVPWQTTDANGFYLLPTCT